MPPLLVASVVLLGAGILTYFGMEVVRGIVHKRRVRRDRLAGTQDIAYWGLLVLVVLFGAATICLGIEIWQSGGVVRINR